MAAPSWRPSGIWYLCQCTPCYRTDQLFVNRSFVESQLNLRASILCTATGLHMRGFSRLRRVQIDVFLLGLRRDLLVAVSFFDTDVDIGYLDRRWSRWVHRSIFIRDNKTDRRTDFLTRLPERV